ncbi:MAG: hypothetical protein HY360_14660 [Verrucomicrobia bacterium]|nr:hypothetical protein [Verrucomicrobiota bacterium]
MTHPHSLFGMNTQTTKPSGLLAVTYYGKRAWWARAGSFLRPTVAATIPSEALRCALAARGTCSPIRKHSNTRGSIMKALCSILGAFAILALSVVGFREFAQSPYPVQKITADCQAAANALSRTVKESLGGVRAKDPRAAESEAPPKAVPAIPLSTQEREDFDVLCGLVEP